MAEKVQANVATVATEEAAQAAAEQAVNDILAQGHHLIGDPEIRPVEIDGQPMYAVWITYERLTPAEVAAEQQAAAAAAGSEEDVAAAAAAASAPARKGLWWKVLLAAIPVTAAVGAVGYLGVKHYQDAA